MGRTAPIGSTAWYIAGIAHRKDELGASSWWSSAKALFPENEFRHIRCLGLGEISESITARYQLAFLLLLMDYLGVDSAQVSLWDPKFSAQDVEILSTYNLAVEEVVAVAAHTLWFVPHGPASLNLQLAADPAVVWFLGNDLIAYEPRTPLRADQVEALEQYRQQVERKKLAVKSSDRWFTAFNDTALQRRLQH